MGAKDLVASDKQEGASTDDGAVFAAVVDARDVIEVAAIHGWERASVTRLRTAAAELARRKLPAAGGISQVLVDLADRVEEGERPYPQEQIRLDLVKLLALVRPVWWPAVDDPDPAF